MNKKLIFLFTALFIMILLVAFNKKEESEEIIEILYGHVENEIVIEVVPTYDLVRVDSKINASELLDYECNTNNYVVTDYPYA